MKTQTTPFNRLEIILESLQEKHDAEWCSHYGEPGYSDPEKGIIFCNWNNVSQPIQDYLESQGYELEWSDEWYVDYDNSKAWRTSPDSYDWTSSIKYCDGYILTPDNDILEWFEECKSTDYNQPHSTLPQWITPEQIQEQGYKEWKTELPLETGFHPGQNDNPADIYKQALDLWKGELESMVFQIESKGQFDIRWKAYFRLEDWSE